MWPKHVALGFAIALSVGFLLDRPAKAAPFLTDPFSSDLDLVVTDSANLNLVDGLTFDAFGNLYAALEITGAAGGVTHIDTTTGTATQLISGLSRADQIEITPPGDLYVTCEVGGTSTTNRLFRVDVTYDGANAPISAIATSITTGPDGINNPEGLVALTSNSAFGNAGDLFVAEDIAAGQIVRVTPGAADTGATTVWVDTAENLRRPEGLAFGDFGGAATAALYTAETTDNNILRIDENGNVSVFGDPGAVGLTSPDNVEFGPDGFLYVSEDVGGGNGRIIRIAPDGTHTVFAEGLDGPQGMVFDPVTGDMYISEQFTDSIWKVSTLSTPNVLTAAFAPDVTKINPGVTVNFTNQTDLFDGSGYTHDWTFGTGEGTSTLVDPSHQYNNSGLFGVGLIVTHPLDNDNEAKLGLIEVVDASLAAFLQDFAAVEQGGLVQFTDNSGGFIESWLWEIFYQEGGFALVHTSTAINPQFQFDDRGTYHVQLTVNNTLPGSGQDFTFVAGAVTVIPEPGTLLLAGSGLLLLTRRARRPSK